MKMDEKNNVDLIYSESSSDSRSLSGEGSSYLGGGIVLPGGKSELKTDGSGSQSRNDGIVVKPTPGFVVKTKYGGSNIGEQQQHHQKKLFINVCYHGSIEAPRQKKKLDSNGKEVDGLNLPISVGPIRCCMDKSGNPSDAIDCIVNPEIKNRFETEDSSGSYRHFVCQILMECVEKKYPCFKPIDRKYTLPCLSYKGYVDSRTGEITKKGSKYAEVAKQVVRDTSTQPCIEEILSASRVGEVNPRVTKKQESHPKYSKSKNTLKGSIPVNIDVLLLNESSMSLGEFIANVNAYLNQNGNEPSFDVASFYHDDNVGGEKGNSPFLIHPLLCCHNVCEDLTISRLVITAQLPRKNSLNQITTNDIKVELSNYLVNISAPNIETECMLPFCVNTKTAKCLLNTTCCSLTINVSISQDDNTIDLGPDVGSQQWTVAQAFSRGNKHVSGKPSLKNEKTHHVKNLNTEQNIGKRKTDLSCGDEYGIDGLNKQSLQNDPECDLLPEDGFHKEDIFSQHMLAQQEEERKKKAENFDSERRERNVTKDLSSTKSDTNIEYLNADDFRPGGKYFENSDGPIDQNLAVADKNITLKKAESFLEKNFMRNSICKDIWSKLV